MSRSRLALAVCAALVGLGVVGSCSVGTDDSPRDIDPAAVDDTVVPGGNSGAAATGSGRIYLLAADRPESVAQHLQPVPRDVATDDPEAVIEALLDGPNSAEFVEQLRTAIPPNLVLNSARLRSGGILEVDVSEPLQELSSDLLISAVAQIVYTASTLDGVSSVLISVNGATSQWPAGNGELQDEPLTVYDYPGLEPSTQPAYPGIPPAEGSS